MLESVSESEPMVLSKTVEERKAMLANHLAIKVASGYRIESQGDAMAVLVRGRRVNHILHFFIGIFTLGLWWLAWIFLAIVGGERRQLVTVDEQGNLLVQKA